MKKILAYFAVLILLGSLAACNLSAKEPEGILNRLDGIVGQIGNSQITSDDALQGIRNNTEDSYTGEYIAECNNETGRDVIFGGGSIEKRCVRIHGHISLKSGKATVRIRMNSIIKELEIDKNGNFETVLNMASGGNYIMVDYKNFSGSVKLISEYCPEPMQEI